ncbi:G patch domain-containing protein 2-like [Agrilus planipennis]|uniref:G patch domain-containing protein 2 n=1 Tax=Agrilus planipennis TaxID=224129 RepID=A0A1W4X1U8_AGRPL|nr:G patch domain-containing protein 2 [Agrilus planipennis]XP_025835284.1 G patch domain-containing protein 2-like [Agrilus planipennis]
MDHLAQDLSVALEESESCGPAAYETAKKWGFRRRTRSTGNLHLPACKAGDYHSDDSSSSTSEIRIQQLAKNKLNQSDSDELSLRLAVTKAVNKSHSLRMKHQINSFLRGRYNRLGLPLSHSLESDSLNEHSPARPMRRKRKLKRMNIDENPVPPCGKRKRPQRLDAVENYRSLRNSFKIKPLHPSITNKIQQYYQNEINECNMMETQCINDNCDVASESSLSWSGGEGHEGDDELTDWAPSIDNAIDQAFWNDIDPREIRAGCRRLREERPSYSISTGANERVARFLQDATKSELHLYGVEREKLGQLAALYSLDMWFEEPGCSLLRKTKRTPCMQPAQRYHSGFSAAYKKIRTHNHVIS